MLPTAQDVRDYLEGFGVTTALLTDTWILKRRDQNVVPIVERGTGLSVTGTKQVTELYSGNGTARIILDRAPIKSLDEFAYTNSFDSNITLDSIEVDLLQGILVSKSSFDESTTRQLFAKGTENLKITYTYGFASADIPLDIHEAILLLLAERALKQIAARCGGGDLNIKELARNYGNLGEYGRFQAQMKSEARALLDPYVSGVVGG